MPARSSFGSRPKRAAAGLADHWLARVARGVGLGPDPEAQDHRDRNLIDRAQRLTAFVDDPEGIWQRDLLPILADWYDKVEDGVLAGERHPDALVALRGVVAQIDATRKLGASALLRWTERRSRSEIATAMAKDPAAAGG